MLPRHRIMLMLGVPIGIAIAAEVIILVKYVVTHYWKQADDYAYRKIVVDTKVNPRFRRAIVEEIKNQNLHISLRTLYEMEDGYQTPGIIVPLGSYIIERASFVNSANKRINVGRIHIRLDKDQITIRSCQVAGMNETNMNDLRAYIEDIYARHNAPTEVMMFYTSMENEWSAPICRRPRNFSPPYPSKHVQTVVDEVDGFMSLDNRKELIKNGLPVRKGFLFHGRPGTGKSLCVEIVAKKYGMSVYLLTLNATNMTDSKLINLFCEVPPNSIIVVDEIDDQLETLQNNATTNVSIGGLLSAIDGPQRLSDSTIVILTANSKDFLPKDKMEALCRKGRIDRVIDFDEE